MSAARTATTSNGGVRSSGEPDPGLPVEELMRLSQEQLATYGSDKFDNFYAAFSGAAILETAVKEGTVPFSNKRSLNAYFKKVYAKRAPTPEAKRPLPYPYDRLAQLQGKDGRWTNEDKMLDLLQLPRSVLLDGLEPWENATVFALAAIRQRPDLAEDLLDAHDRAFQWIESRGLVYRALERIYAAEAPSQDDSPTATAALPPASEDSLHIGEPADTARTEYDNSATAIPALASVAFASVSAPASGRLLQAEEVAGGAEEVKEEAGATSVSGPPSPSAAAAKGRAFIPGDPSAQFDCERIASDLKELEEKVVGFAIEFESISLRLERVYKQAVKTYNAASTHSERNVAFDELTCILGEGLRPISGVTDWRAAGAPSFRRACLDILSSLQRIAELRLDLEEARLRWQGHPLRMPAPSADMVDARWTFSWGGRDLARIVLSSLDWLQAVPTVTDWYGRPFSFVANPLSLPLNLVDVYNQLGMEFKVEEQMNMRPFAKILCGAQGQDAQHKQRIFLNRWQISFEALVSKARISRLWPENPDVSNFACCDRMYSALLVVFVKGRRDVARAIGTESKAHCETVLAQSRDHFQRETLRQLGRSRSGKPGSGWRGSIELSNTAQQKGGAVSAGGERTVSPSSSWKPLPKLSVRPTASRQKPLPASGTDAVVSCATAKEVAPDESSADESSADNPFLSAVISFSTDPKKKKDFAFSLSSGPRRTKSAGAGATAEAPIEDGKKAPKRLPPVKASKKLRPAQKSKKVARAAFPGDVKLTRKAVPD